MITINISGPQGAGKTRIAGGIRDMLDEMGVTHLLLEEATPAAIDTYKPDVIIVTEIAR